MPSHREHKISTQTSARARPANCRIVRSLGKDRLQVHLSMPNQTRTVKQSNAAQLRSDRGDRSRGQERRDLKAMSGEGEKLRSGGMHRPMQLVSMRKVRVRNAEPASLQLAASNDCLLLFHKSSSFGSCPGKSLQERVTCNRSRG